jgi:hypothetical protein
LDWAHTVFALHPTKFLFPPEQNQEAASTVDTPKTAFAVTIVIAGAIVIVGGGALAAVLWWRRHFRRMFEARFQPQEDGSYLVHWTRGRGKPIEVYRIDAKTKTRALTCLVDGSVVTTCLFVVLIIAAVVINVLWPTRAMIPAAFVLAIAAFAPQRRASRRVGRLILAGNRVEGAENIKPLGPSPEVTARSLRLIILVSCLIAVMGVAVVVIFVLDPDSGAIAWTDRQILSLLLLLVMLPISVALFSWWALRRTRSQPRPPDPLSGE